VAEAKALVSGKYSIQQKRGETFMYKTTHVYRLKNFRRGLCALTFALFLCLPAWLPQEASACACCSNEGQWFEYKKKLDKVDLEELNGTKFAAKSRLYETDAEDEGITLTSSDFTLKFSRAQSKWTMTLQGSEGEKGSLILNLPPSVTYFGSDPRDGKASSAGPLLYKEVRLEGRLSGTGVFAKSLKPDSRYRLVLQGRGNVCMLAEDFNNWILQIYGRQVRFGFHGSFDKKPDR
jgi:hypothetical protein